MRDLGEVVRLINSEHIYDDPLPKKSLYKILYFIDKESESKEVDVSIPYFWYQFGTVSPISEIPPKTEQRSLSKERRDGLKDIVNTVLKQYYKEDLESLTDRMYRDAKYDVQLEFRCLDKKLRTLHDDYSNFFDVEPSRNSILDSVYCVYDEFPVAEYPQSEEVLITWYNFMNRELNSSSYDPDKLMEFNLDFWQCFSLHLAEDFRNEMRREEVSDYLGINSFDDARRSVLSQLRSENSTDRVDMIEENENIPDVGRASDPIVKSTIAKAMR